MIHPRYIIADWILPVLLVVLIALPQIAHPPSYDEVLHYVAALGILEHGDVVVASGEYPRARLFSMLVAASFDVFGVSDISARLPAIAASALLVILMFNFVRVSSSRSAAWYASLLLTTAPTFLNVTLMTRFYTLHSLFILCAAVAVFLACEASDRKTRLVLFGTGAIFLIPAYHLQGTTLIALAGLLFAVAIRFLPFVVRWSKRNSKLAMLGFAGVAALSILAYFLLDVAWLWGRLGDTAVWAASRSSGYTFYLGMMRENFGFAWILAPFLFLVALRERPRLTIYCSAMLLVGLAVHTIAAQKAARYAVYLLPFFCIASGIGIARLIKLFQLGVTRTFAEWAVPQQRRSASALVTAAIGFAILVNPNTGNAVKSLWAPAKSSVADTYARIADWKPALQALRPILEDAPTLVTSSGVKSLFYIGYYDYELNVSVVSESVSGRDFGTDSRTGGLVIGKLTSLRHVIECSASGVIIADDSKWRVDSHISNEVADYIESNLRQVSVPRHAKLHVYAWHGDPVNSANCADFPVSRAVMSPRRMEVE